MIRNGSTVAADGTAYFNHADYGGPAQTVETLADLNQGDHVLVAVDHGVVASLAVLHYSSISPEFSMTWMAP